MIGDGSCWNRKDLSCNPEKAPEREITAPRHYLVAAELLEKAARKLRANQNIETVAGDLLPILEVMARRL
jgi:hypothetical protein